MVFPFGVSLSDFVLLIKLVIDTIQGASDIRRARSDFTKLLQSLTSLNGALSFMLALRLDTEARREALESTVANCRTCVEDFLVDVAKFRVLKCEYATKARMIMNLRKIQWALCKKEDVRKFHAELEIHIGALEMLLLTFQM